MAWLNKLPGYTRSPAGLEWRLWKRLPTIALLGTVLPGAVLSVVWLQADHDTAAAERAFTQYLYIGLGFIMLHWTLVITLAIGCVIVILMKGSAYVADGLEVSHRGRPGGP